MEFYVQIQTRDLEKARDITQWLINHVGPVVKPVGSTVMRGEGWIFWVLMEESQKFSIKFEIDERIVDRHTITLFLLKWS